MSAPITLDTCPKKHLHTRCPRGYVAWHEWAERKSRRHFVIRCPGCNLYAIWKRKPAGGAEGDTE